MDQWKFLDTVYWNNSIQAYLTALTIFVVLVLLIRLLRKVALRRLKSLAARTETTLDDFIIKAMEKAIMPLLNFGAFYLAAHSLELSARAGKLLYSASAVLVAFVAIRLAQTAIRHAVEVQVLKREDGKQKLGQVKGIMVVISVALWIIGILFLFDNFGYDITAIVTGLGIGGIAIALAAQNILGDLFNYFVIFFDRPFEVGDFIVIDDKRGTVEQIGIKTSRIRSITGEELVFANSRLTSSCIHNFKRMERRRSAFQVGVTYQTSSEHLRDIPGIIQQAVEGQEDVQFDRSHFHSFADSCLIFETVFFVNNAEYNRFMDVQQAVNMRIYEEFNRRGIQFAYPTQTVYLKKENV
jgi:small-conductance mechanosensitive channel